jgi:hypothetical protein
VNLTDALKVVDLIDKYTGAEGQDFPTDKQILDSLFVLRDALVNAACITYDEKGQMQATAATERALQNAKKDLPAEQLQAAMRQRALPTEVQFAINAQLKDCGRFLKPALLKAPDQVQPVFNGLLEALVSVAEVGVTGRRDPRIVVPGERLN